MNATSSADIEDREAQTSYADSVLTAMKQVHNTIEHLEVTIACVMYSYKAPGCVSVALLRV